jgi:hypothetical protein
LLTKLTPVGSAPVSERFGDGVPDDTTVNVLELSTTNVVVLAVVITGAIELAEATPVAATTTVPKATIITVAATKANDPRTRAITPRRLEDAALMTGPLLAADGAWVELGGLIFTILRQRPLYDVT